MITAKGFALRSRKFHFRPKLLEVKLPATEKGNSS